MLSSGILTVLKSTRNSKKIHYLPKPLPVIELISNYAHIFAKYTLYILATASIYQKKIPLQSDQTSNPLQDTPFEECGLCIGAMQQE